MPKVNRKVLLFAHIPKCAGMSLRRALAANYPEGETYTLTGWCRQEIEESVARLRGNVADGKEIALVMGHFAYGFHRSIGLSEDDVAYISMMREPVSRIYSLFKYIRAEQLHQDHDEVKELSFSEFIRTEKMLSEISNVQAKHLLGIQPPPPPEKAVASLRRLVCDARLIVGTVEQYRKTLGLMDVFLGLPLENFVTNQSPGSAQLVSEADRLFLERINRTDFALWRAVETMLGWMPSSAIHWTRPRV